MNTLTHAVLYQDDEGYHVLKEDHSVLNIQLRLPEHLPDWLPGLARQNIDVMWVMPGTYMNMNRAEIESMSRDVYSVHCTYKEDLSGSMKRDRLGSDHPMFLRMRRHDRIGGERYFSWPEHNEWTRSSRWQLDDAETLLTTVSYVEQELEMPLLWSVPHMALETLKVVHRRRTGSDILPFDQSQLVLWQQFIGEHGRYMMPRPAWTTLLPNGEPGLSKDARKKRYLIGYDKNWSFGGAANGLKLPIGAFERVGGDEFSKDKMGFWLYRIIDVEDTQFDGYSLYCPLDVSFRVASTDLIAFAIEQGVHLAIDSGIVWSNGGRYLEQWTKEHWQRRLHIRDAAIYQHQLARENAIDTMKGIGNSLFGKFRSAFTMDEYQHPEWDNLIIHRAIASQAWTIAKIVREYGIRPVMIETDCIYILSDEGDPVLAIPGMLDHRNELRGFKPKCVVPMTDELSALFASRVSASQRVGKILKHIGEEAYAQEL